MSKHQHQQTLSPEKYIRTRARALPIGPCYINTNWRDSGKAMITVTRVHINGNITFGAFLVDLYCLGVKEAFWDFNRHPADFEKYIDGQQNGNPYGIRVMRTDYVLVHNIIYGAVEYAGEIGFYPHRSFEPAKYILEEDDEHVKLINIEFGYKGKPFYISSPVNPAEKNRVLAHLNNKLGPGNFNFITEEDADEFFEKEDEADAVNYKDSEVKRDTIKNFVERTNLSGKGLMKDPDELGKLMEAGDVVFYHYMTTKDELEKASGIIAGLFGFRITKEIFSEEMLFGKSPGRANMNEIRREAEKIWHMIYEDENLAEGLQSAERMIAKYPGIPVFEYIHLRFLEIKTGMSKLLPVFKQRLDRDPDYLPYIYMYAESLILNKPADITIRQMDDSAHLKNLYPGRTSYCIEEALLYIHLLNLNYMESGNFVMVEELFSYLDYHHPGLLPETEMFTAKLAKIPFVRKWCENWLKENNTVN